MEGRYQKLTSFFQELEREYHVTICIKDFTGFIPVNKELDAALQPFLAHTNDFCMYIKSDKAKYRDCLSMIGKMSDKSLRLRHTFFGMCHAGLFEYVTPIIGHGIVLGTINLGFFDYPKKDLPIHQIRRVCRSSFLLQEEEALRLYWKSIHPTTAPIEKLLPSIELVADYLALTYEALQDTHGIRTKKRVLSSEDTILSDACAYIRQHFTETIRISDLAFFCHCSESYLSKIFQRRMKVHISTYINKVRVEASKDFLKKGNTTVSDIASSVGFNDPNYYSRIFSRLVGISPLEFKRRFREDAPLSRQSPREEEG